MVFIYQKQNGYTTERIVYKGSKWLNDYNVSLDKLPFFVKAGAIIPLYPQINFEVKGELIH
jgi:alpha-glucosidase (family GH31 glycosyl hydrolase)